MADLENNIESGTSPRVSTSPYLIPGAIVAAGLLIAAAVLYSNSGFGGRAAAPQTQPAGIVSSAPTATGDIADDDPSLGDPQASVTIVEFSDFQCPFCKRFFDAAEKEIIETYVKTGKARFVYRDFPLTGIHEHAQKAAEAGECADEQKKFWSYHDVLFQRQAELGVANFKLWARELGLDGGQFDQCLDSGKYANEVQKDFQDGQALGVTGTPGTFVNGRLIVGAVPFAQFQAAIEEAIKSVR